MPVAVAFFATSRGVPSATMRPPASPPSGPSSIDPVGGGDHGGVVLDDDERVAALDEAIEDADEARDVGEVEAGRRLVEHVDRRLGARAGGELGGELEALRLAARERVRALAELQIADAEIAHDLRAGARSWGGRRRR